MTPPVAFINPFGAHRAAVPSLDVLVVDRADDDRERLCTLLRMAGHRVTTSERGECALDVLRGGTTAVVMVSGRLPDLALVPFVERLHALPLAAASQPHVVALFPGTEAAPCHTLKAAGITTCLATPVAVSRLLELLAMLAKRIDPECVQPLSPPVGTARTANLDPRMLDELAALGLGGAFEREFITQCLSDLETAVAGVEAACRALNWPHMRDYALGVKGVASSVGLVRLVTLAESMVKAQDWALVRDGQAVAARLRDALSEARVLLRERTRGPAQASPLDATG